MVKKVFVFSLQQAKAHDELASPSTLGARFQNQKRELSAKCCGFQEPIAGAAVGRLMPLKYPVRELPALQFFGGIGSNNRAEELQDS
jgi:hypothetical protein